MKRLLSVLLAVVALVLGAAAWLLLSPASVAKPGALEFSGTLEARQVAVVVEVTGQVTKLPVREGDTVAAGDVLVTMDTAMQDAQIARARAAVRSAQASLAQVKAGARPEQLDGARATFDRQVAARDGAASAVKNLQAILDDPQELDAEIAQTRAQLKAAEAAIVQAQNQRRAAVITRDHFAGDSTLEGRAQFQAGEAAVRAGDAAIAAATASRDGAQTALDLLLAMRANPRALTSQLHAAQAMAARADAMALLARAELDGLATGPRAEEVAIAQAQVDMAQAALDQLVVQRQKMTLTAPISGMVTSLSVRNGENVQPGAKLMTVANLDNMRLTLYVPNTQVGRVRVGQLVRVTVDGLPGQALEGRVYFISSRAEYPPAAVQTKDERAKMVFMIKVSMDNPLHTLKPGMPADAVVLE